MPAALNSLTCLRFVLAAWVVIFHFRKHIEYDADAWIWVLVSRGYLAVDAFFVLSGFILWHVYNTQLAERRFDYGLFVAKRFARIYPGHFVTTLIMTALYLLVWAAGMKTNLGADQLWELPAHLMLAHGWGVLDRISLNYPSWSISGEWFAYLVFPFLAYLAASFTRWRGLLFAFAVFALAYIWVDGASFFDGKRLTTLTYATLPRILVEFFLGICLHRVVMSMRLTRLMAGAVAGLVFAGVVGLIMARAPDWTIVPLLVALIGVFALHDMARGPVGERAGALEKGLIYLGEISYALYLTHALVEFVFFRGVERVLGFETAGAEGLVMGIGFLIALVSAAALYEMVENPARKWLPKVLMRWRDKSAKRIAQER